MAPYKWRIFKMEGVWILVLGPYTRAICRSHAAAVRQMNHLIRSHNWVV